MAGCDQSAAAVATRTCQHRHGGGEKRSTANQARLRPAFSIICSQPDTEVLDHDPVDFSHLVGGDRRDLAHRSSIPPRSGRLTSGRLRLRIVA